MKKPFKDTKAGVWLKDKGLSGILATVGDVLPDKGVFGIVKGIISKSTISDADKNEFSKILAEQELEHEKLELQNIEGARAMQIASYSQDDKFLKRFVAYFTVFLSLSTFSLIAGLYFLEVPASNKDIVYMCLGLFIGSFSAAVTFWIGSSVSSKSKDKMIDNIINKR